MNADKQRLIDFVRKEQAQPVSAAVVAMAQAARERHHGAVVAALFYGSCLRAPEAEIADGLLDFYLLVDDYEAAYGGRRLPALANAILPPNVFYLEAPWQDRMLRCKYAIMSLAQFGRACGVETLNVSVWARFSQPSRLAWSQGDETAAILAAACAEAAMTMIGNYLPLAGALRDPVDLWSGAMRETYRAELRSEKSGRGAAIVAADRERYEAITPIILRAIEDRASVSFARARADWRTRRLMGKALNALRLCKAAFTFQGGLDYILWKVKRHSGVEIHVSEWQRRHPLLAAPGIALRLYRKGAFR